MPWWGCKERAPHVNVPVRVCDGAVRALRAVDEDHAACDGALEDIPDVRSRVGAIARPIRLNHNT